MADTLINTDRIRQTTSDRFTSDSEMNSKVNASDLVVDASVPIPASSFSGNTYTDGTLAGKTAGVDYMVFDSTGGLVLLTPGTDYTAITNGFTLTNPVGKGVVLIGKMSALANIIAEINAISNTNILTDKLLLLPNNLIVGEGSTTPTQITLPGLGFNCTMTAVANSDSPYNAQLPYKRRITNAFVSGASTYFYNQQAYPLTPPTSISLAFWIKDSDVAVAFAGTPNKNYTFWFFDQTNAAIVSSAIFDIITVTASVGNNQSGTVSNSLATSNWGVVCLDKQRGYSFIAITLSSIVYAGGFVPSIINLYHVLTATMPNTWTKIDTAGWVLLYNNTVTSSDVYPDGFSNLQYPPSTIQLSNNVGAIENVFNKNGFLITITGNILGSFSANTLNIYVRAYFNETYDIVVIYTVNALANNALNIGYAKLVLKTDGITAPGMQLPGASADDAAPTALNNGYFTGNHGNFGAIKTVATAHGKDVTDDASTWADALGHHFHPIQIIDANTIQWISDNLGGAHNWGYYATISGNLTHVSGAQHTGAITIASQALSMVLPAVKNQSIAIMADNKPISAHGTYQASKLKFGEIYDGVDTNDMVAKMIANKPSGGYLTQPDLTAGNAIISVRNAYILSEQCKVTINFTWINREDLTLEYFGGTQVNFFAISWATSIKRYIPSSLPISDTSNTYDFRLGVDITTLTFAAAMNFTSAYWEGSIPVRRVFDVVTNGSLAVVFNVGVMFIGVGSVANRSLKVENALQVYTNKKLYFHVIDDVLNTTGAPAYLPAGAIAQGAMFRGWSEQTSARTNFYIYKQDNDYYINLDWHIITNDVVPLPDYLVGKTVSVVEASANVSVQGPLAMGTIDIAVTTASPQYAYCTLKLT